MVYRSGLGVAGLQAHEHGQHILKEGFSMKKAADVVAFEHDGSEDVVTFNRELAELSGGLIPHLEQVRYVSVGGGHTNAFLRATKACCRTPIEELQDGSGKLSTAKLSMKQPLFAQAVQNGLKWFIIDKRSCRPSVANTIMYHNGYSLVCMQMFISV